MRSLLEKGFLLLSAIFIMIPQMVFAMPEIMPLENVETGMSGVAYTVVDNSGIIKPFNVDIIGLVENGKGSSKMIMAKASGDVIEETGGILQGMSGSPVYIDGKLVGAVSAGLKEMNPYTFFITPIEDMLKLWELPDDRVRVMNDAEVTVEDENNSETEAEAETETKAETETAAETETKTPEVEEKATLFFSGFDSSGSNFLRNEMSSLGFRNFFAMSSQFGSENMVRYDATLEPGEPVGAAVVCGDFVVGVTGTVTAVEGKKMLAFGHSFTHAGNVSFFMTDSSVIGSVSGENGNGVKIAKVGNIIGRVNQDREAGIAGILGKFPSVVPISVTVKDLTLNREETYNSMIAYNENLIPKLGAAITYAALSKTSDSLTESTVNVGFEIKTNVVSDGVLSRQNMFYNSSDVGQVAILELMQALNIICSNTTEESNIYGIDVTMTLETERKTASLISAVPDKVKVKPGETVNFTVTLQPYRKPNEILVVPYTVPLTRGDGPLTLDFHGGSLVQVQTNASGLISPSNNSPAKNYEEKIKALLNTGRNNQLVIEPSASAELKSEKDLKKDIARAKKMQERLAKSGQKSPAPKENKFDTNYIIDNVIQVTVNVDKI